MPFVDDPLRERMKDVVDELMKDEAKEFFEISLRTLRCGPNKISC
jgi:hypothetical protein